MSIESSTPGSGTPPPSLNKAQLDKRKWLESQDEGYHKGLSKRQIQMIAIGGAIGTGLFLGAGQRLEEAGPALTLVYAICGVFAFLILRALGELVLHRPTSGSFVSYAREFIGEKGAFVAGWMYYFNWALTGIADLTAVALYVQYWNALADVPAWVTALIALALITAVNLIGVKYFGEMEFWFSVVKVGALVLFLIVGTAVVLMGHPLPGEQEIGLQLIFNEGFFPNVVAAVVMIQGVVFAYAAIELVGMAAGETPEPEKVLPRAINSVILRMAIFYVGSVALLALAMPYTQYKADESPFVTFFNDLGVPYAGSVMNFVVITAALSSLNSGMYSTGRVLRSLAMGGSAPPFVNRMSKKGVPYGGLIVTLTIYLIGVLLNAFVPDQAFNIVLNAAALGILSTWGFIVVSQMLYRKAVARGEADPPSFKLPGAPFTAWLTLAFLAAVLVLMGFDYPTGTWTVASIPVIAIALVVGWQVSKRRVEAMSPTFDDSVNQPPLRIED